MSTDDLGVYTESEYTFLRKVAFTLKEFMAIWHTTRRIEEEVLSDIREMMKEDIDEF